MEIADKQKDACIKLLSFSRLINPYIGDALSDLLAVEAILHSLNMSVEQWDALYEPFPNMLSKIKVSDRTMFKTTDAERSLTEPLGLQAKINAVFNVGSLERATVR